MKTEIKEEVKSEAGDSVDCVGLRERSYTPGTNNFFKSEVGSPGPLFVPQSFQELGVRNTKRRASKFLRHTTKILSDGGYTSKPSRATRPVIYFATSLLLKEAWIFEEDAIYHQFFRPSLNW